MRGAVIAASRRRRLRRHRLHEVPPRNALLMLKPWTPRLRQQTDAKALRQLLRAHVDDDAAAPVPLLVLVHSSADGEAEFGRTLVDVKYTTTTTTPHLGTSASEIYLGETHLLGAAKI